MTIVKSLSNLQNMNNFVVRIIVVIVMMKRMMMNMILTLVTVTFYLMIELFVDTYMHDQQYRLFY